MRQRPTPEEAAAAALETVREGFSHRRWPPDVVSSFARAEVIRRGTATNGAGVTPPGVFRSALVFALRSLRPRGGRAVT